MGLLARFRASIALLALPLLLGPLGGLGLANDAKDGPYLILDPSWKGKGTVQHLKWDTGGKGQVRWGAEAPIDLEVNRQGNRTTGIGRIRGFYGRKDWKLLTNLRETRRASDGTFQLKLEINAPRSAVLLTVVGPKGQVEEQRYLIHFPGFQEWRAEQNRFFNKRYFLSASAGLSVLSYEETFAPQLDQLGLTAKVSYQYLLKPPRLDLGFSGYVTAVPLRSSVAGTHARFLGLNARLGYVVPGIPDPWRLSLMGGVYYTSMLVPGDALGFRNLMGPQLFPLVRRILSNGNALSGYFKFSPVGSGFGLENLGNREIAAGVSFTQRTSTWNAISYAVDLAELKLDIEGVAIRSRSASFSVGMSW